MTDDAGVWKIGLHHIIMLVVLGWKHEVQIIIRKPTFPNVCVCMADGSSEPWRLSVRQLLGNFLLQKTHRAFLQKPSSVRRLFFSFVFCWQGYMIGFRHQIYFIYFNLFTQQKHLLCLGKHHGWGEKIHPFTACETFTANMCHVCFHCYPSSPIIWFQLWPIKRFTQLMLTSWTGLGTDDLWVASFPCTSTSFQSCLSKMFTVLLQISSCEHIQW